MDFRPVSGELHADPVVVGQPYAGLPGIGGDGIERRVGAQLEGEGTGVLGVSASELQDNRRSEAAAVAGVYADLVGEEVVGPGAHGQLPEGVRSVVRRIEQVAEGDAHVVVAKRPQERDRVARRPGSLDECSEPVLFRRHMGRQTAVRCCLVGLREDAGVHVVARVLEAAQQHESGPGAIAELARQSRGPEVGKAAAVRLRDVGVELLDLIAAVEGVGLNRQLRRQEARIASDNKMKQRRKEVPAREVDLAQIPAAGELRGHRAGEPGRGQRARLLDGVRGEEIGDPDVALLIAVPQLAVQLRQARARDVAPAVRAEIAARNVVVEGPDHPPGLSPGLPPAEAASGQLDLGLAARATAARDYVQRAGEGVSTEGTGGSADHLDPLDVVQRDQVEVDLCGVGLVHPHPINEDADALGQTNHRRDGEAAERDVRLIRRAQLVVGVDAGQAAQRVRNRENAGRTDLVVRAERHEEGDSGGVDAAQGEAAHLYPDLRELDHRRVGGLRGVSRVRRLGRPERRGWSQEEQRSYTESEGFPRHKCAEPPRRPSTTGSPPALSRSTPTPDLPLFGT